jgi:hypothetical protein
MPWWAWVVGIAMVVWACVQLRRAMTLGKINAGVVDFTRASDPPWFWFQVGVNLLVVVLFGGGMLVILVR